MFTIEALRMRSGDQNRDVLIDRALSSDGATKRETVPVSYTHLRAHETVLDLVCRLLLEKKN